MEHRLISGGEQYLPFARARVKAMRATGLTYASQQFEIDGASIKVRIEPGQEYITLSGGSSLYEFFSTGPVLNIDNSYVFDMYRGYGVAVAVDRPNKTLRGRPSGSTLEASDATPPAWAYSDDANDMNKFMQHKGVFQIQGAVEHQFFPDLKPPRFVASVWTGASQVNGLVRGGVNDPGQYLRDVGYDIAPSIFNATGYPTGRRGLAPDTDWYRRAATRTVTHADFGPRQFILMTDATGSLHVYPMTEQEPGLAYASPYLAQGIKTNVPADVTQTRKIPFPGWVRTSAGMARDSFPGAPSTGSYRWEFNSTATRMACVLASDLGPTFYGVTEDDPTLSGRPVGATESLPGMLEIQIDVAITGAEAKDFSITLSVSDEIIPTSETYVIAADYHWGDLPEMTAPGPVAKDSLVYMTMDIYHKRLEGPPPSGQSEAGFAAMHARAKVVNRVNGSVLREFTMHAADAPYGMDGVPYSGSLLQAYYGKAYAAALKLGISGPGAGSGLTQPFLDESAAFMAGLTTVSCETLAQYDKIVQTYLDNMRDHARSTESTWGAAAIAEYNKESVRQKSYLARMLYMPQDSITLKTWLLAYDLRIMAFATQTAAFKNTGNQTTRQDRVQIIVRNQVVETIDAPDPAFAALISASDAPWDLGPGWSRLGVMSTTNPSASIQGYRSLATRQTRLFLGTDVYDPARTTIGQAPNTRTDFNVVYPHGAVDYNFYAQSFLSMEADDVFCVHPAGHWAITIKPIGYFSGVSAHVYPYSPNPAPSIDAGAFVQQMVDIVNVRVTSVDATGAKIVEDFRAKHLDLFNQAYGKTAQLADFKLLFSSSVNSANSGQATVTLATATSPNVPDPRAVNYVSSVFVNTAGDRHGVNFYSVPSYFGLRDLSCAQAYTDIRFLPGSTVTTSGGRIGDTQANLRGACLFTGELIQR